MTLNDFHMKMFELWKGSPADSTLRLALDELLDDFDIVNGESDFVFPTDNQLAQVAYGAFMGAGYQWEHTAASTRESWKRAVQAVLKEIAK